MPSFVTTGAPILQAPPLVMVLLLLSVAIGRPLLIRLRCLPETASKEHAFAAVGVGLGVLQLVPFALGAVGLLSVRNIWIALGLSCALFARGMLRSLLEVAHGLRHHRWTNRVTLAWSLALVPGLAAAALLALTPTLDPDGLGYHLTVPKRWLESHSLHYLPTYPNSNMPMGVEMLYTLALASAGDAAAKFLHFAVGALGAGGLYVAGKRLMDERFGLLAATLYLFGPGGVGGLLGWAYQEGATCYAAITATLAWLVWLETRQLGWLRACFLLCGVGVSFKITAGLLPLVLVALTWLWSQPEGRLWPLDLRRLPLLSLGCLSLLPVLPWFLRAAYMTGNPFFPVAASLIPSRDFSPELAEQWGHFNRYLNWAIRIGEGWSIAQRKAILLAVAAGFGAVGFVIGTRLRDLRQRRTVWLLSASAILQLAAVGLYIRYWIPVMSVLVLPLLWLVRPALRWPALTWALPLLALGLSLRQAQRSLSLDGDFSSVPRTALGLQSQRSFLTEQLALYPLYERANDALPPNAGILLIAYCGGFYLDRTTFCGDIVQGSLRLTNWREFTTDLKRWHVTHVLAPRWMVGDGAAPPNAAGGVGYMVRANTDALVGQLLRHHATQVGAAADQGLFRIDL